MHKLSHFFLNGRTNKRIENNISNDDVTGSMACWNAQLGITLGDLMARYQQCLSVLSTSRLV